MTDTPLPGTDGEARAAFTPGPWRQDGLHIMGEVAGEGEQFIATASMLRRRAPGSRAQLADTQDETRANAALIAAAPDLYEALETAMRELETRMRAGLAEAGYSAEEIAGIVDACPAIIDARSAISRARGEA